MIGTAVVLYECTVNLVCKSLLVLAASARCWQSVHVSILKGDIQSMAVHYSAKDC